jgi:hypothetical protein
MSTLEADRSHVGPLLLYEIQTSGTIAWAINYYPPFWYGYEGRPCRILAISIDQRILSTILIIKRVAHALILII